MQDKSSYTNNKPQISEGLQNFINAMVEEIVIKGESFEKSKKWLKKYSEAEGLNYENMENNFKDFFELFEDFKKTKLTSVRKILLNQAGPCFLNIELINDLIIKLEEKENIESKNKEKERLVKIRIEKEKEAKHKLEEEKQKRDDLDRIYNEKEQQKEKDRLSEIKNKYENEAIANEICERIVASSDFLSLIKSIYTPTLIKYDYRNDEDSEMEAYSFYMIDEKEHYNYYIDENSINEKASYYLHIIQEKYGPDIKNKIKEKIEVFIVMKKYVEYLEQEDSLSSDVYVIEHMKWLIDRNSLTLNEFKSYLPKKVQTDFAEDEILYNLVYIRKYDSNFAHLTRFSAYLEDLKE